MKLREFGILGGTFVAGTLLTIHFLRISNREVSLIVPSTQSAGDSDSPTFETPNSHGPTYYVVSPRKLQENLRESTDKILRTQLGLTLPFSARNFNSPRSTEFQMDIGDAQQLLADMTEILRDLGPFEGTSVTFNRDRWEDVLFGAGRGMPPGRMVPNVKDGPYKLIRFAPKLEGQAKKDAEEIDDHPAYQFLINPNNGFVVVMLTTTGDD